jgi:hypothetical protein
MLALWLPTLLDLFKSALEQRARQGEITMSKERLMASAGVYGHSTIRTATGTSTSASGLRGW